MWSENGLWSEANSEPLTFTRGERGPCEQDPVGRQTLSESPRMVRTGCSVGQAEQPASGSAFPSSTLTTRSLSAFTASSVAVE